MVEGKLVYDLPSVDAIRTNVSNNYSYLWEEYKRILNPEQYPVDLSQNLYDKKMESIKQLRQRVQEKVEALEEENPDRMQGGDLR